MTVRPLLLSVVAVVLATVVEGAELPEADGYRGIWYFNQPLDNEYRFKYSGGFATYPQQHIPIAIYSEEAGKTFFVYGGTTVRDDGDPQELLHMVSYFDHETGTVPRPRILLNKRTEDAHDNPVLSIDDDGHLWVFSPSHGTSRPSYIHRSERPYSIGSFSRIAITNFSYPQPWHVSGKGFLFLHTRYGARAEHGVGGQRNLFSLRIDNPLNWQPAKALVGIERGDYQISWPHGDRVGTAFDHHPAAVGLNGRANIYYLETPDAGETWLTASGTEVKLPITEAENSTLVYDSLRDDELVYLKDLNYDRAGRPVILFLTSRGFESGPENDPRTWKTLRWDGQRWAESVITTSDNNYDHGSLYIEDDVWRVIAPTAVGPQPYNPGGEMEMWISRNEGVSWQRHRRLTHGSAYNHTYARRPFHAHEDFHAIWADGHGRQPSMSSLYFTDREGNGVWQLPVLMDGSTARPKKIETNSSL